MAQRASCPVCLEAVRTYKCGSGACLTSHDVKGKECAGTNRRVDFAKDSNAIDRAALHRALDAVMDAETWHGYKWAVAKVMRCNGVTNLRAHECIMDWLTAHRGSSWEDAVAAVCGTK